MSNAIVPAVPADALPASCVPRTVQGVLVPGDDSWAAINEFASDRVDYEEMKGALLTLAATLERERGDRAWRCEPPEGPGLYVMRCNENGFRPEYMEVFIKCAQLHVRCPHIGECPIQAYHDGLTFIEWRKVI